MLGNWTIKANAPGDNLSVAISVQHPKLGDYFIATLNAKKVSSSSVSDHALFFWLMPHKVAVWIYWHVSGIWKSPQFDLGCSLENSIISIKKTSLKTFPSYLQYLSAIFWFNFAFLCRLILDFTHFLFYTSLANCLPCRLGFCNVLCFCRWFCKHFFSSSISMRKISTPRVNVYGELLFMLF